MYCTTNQGATFCGKRYDALAGATPSVTVALFFACTITENIRKGMSEFSSGQALVFGLAFMPAQSVAFFVLLHPPPPPSPLFLESPSTAASTRLARVRLSHDHDRIHGGSVNVQRSLSPNHSTSSLLINIRAHALSGDPKSRQQIRTARRNIGGEKNHSRGHTSASAGTPRCSRPPSSRKKTLATPTENSAHLPKHDSRRRNETGPVSSYLSLWGGKPCSSLGSGVKLSTRSMRWPTTWQVSTGGKARPK